MPPRCTLTSAGEPPCGRDPVVRIVDATGDAGIGCDLHGVRALRAITGSRVEPLPGHDGSAIAVYLTARGEGRP